MAASSESKPTPASIIDLHGIREALTTRSNAKTRIIDALQSGDMLVMRSVQHELKALYPTLWADFVDIKPKKYVDSTVAVSALAAHLQEVHGTSLLGGVPDFAHFEAVALARSLKCKLVTAGKALANCKSIASKCGLPKSGIMSISEV
jgi:hypothetical protein